MSSNTGIFCIVGNGTRVLVNEFTHEKTCCFELHGDNSTLIDECFGNKLSKHAKWQTILVIFSQA